MKIEDTITIPWDDLKVVDDGQTEVYEGWFLIVDAWDNEQIALCYDNQCDLYRSLNKTEYETIRRQNLNLTKLGKLIYG